VTIKLRNKAPRGWINQEPGITIHTQTLFCYFLAVCLIFVLEIARAANSPVFGPSVKGFEIVRWQLF